MSSYTSMSYREIAPRYNAINRLPEQAGLAVGKALADLAGRGALLDLGAGAGRLSIPAARCGAQTVSFDLEHAMLAAGRAQAEDYHLGFSAATADVTALPLPSGAFSVVMINNVLHLVQRWQDALQEARRVLAPGGVLVMGRDVLDPQSVASQIRGKWRQIVGALRPDMRPTSAAGPALPATLAEMGGAIQPERTVASWVERIRPAQILHRMATRMHNETWSLDDVTLAEGLPQLKTWAEQSFDLDEVEETSWRFAVTEVKGLVRSPESRVPSELVHDRTAVTRNSGLGTRDFAKA